MSPFPNPHLRAVPSALPSAPDAPAVQTDARRHARLGWWLVIAGLCAFLLWAAVAPLDQGVPMGGTLTVAGNKKAVQHQSGGTVEAILVKEGETVKAGQPLVQMNSVQARANADTTRTQYLAALGTEARLLAERDGRSTIVFPPEVQADPRFQERLKREVPLGRLVGAEEDAEFAAYLCSDLANCFVGQVFPVCGGWVMR